MEEIDAARTLMFLIEHSYTERGTDGVLYWCPKIFPVVGETFESALAVEMKRVEENL